MDLIRDPLRYTSLQTKIIHAVVQYIYDYRYRTKPEQVMSATFELTEDIARLHEKNPSNLDNLPEHCCDALFQFDQIQGVQGLVSQDTGLKAPEKGFGLLARWMQALYEYAKLTG